ncbi:10778_t:CDS:2 [Gigaspora margarita]|uniref:10778_t:CDS:1 n=1 Tax=Gigaspora margarita TaxID=4874 RepID=A0ABN7UI07_GIGMA|nr:10778_t:CDS:2 [Gigaspora margarita]
MEYGNNKDDARTKISLVVQDCESIKTCDLLYNSECHRTEKPLSSHTLKIC